MDQLLQGLNDSQRKAVEYIDGPSLVIAGAGSGKTRVLTYKIAYLLLNGYHPWNILALTFTNKAAREMKSRIGALVGDDKARNIQMGTFHSVFARILRVEAEQIGFNNNYTIYDESDSRSLLKSIIKEMNLDDKVYKPATVHNIISMAKNRLISADQYAIDRHARQRDNDMKIPAVSSVYSAYAARCRQANAMDFDDLLMLTYQLFNEHEDVRRKYAEKFKYVLVDEYQDTNYAQQCIVLQLSREHQHVCVVGDDAQSIYAFRGANIDNILGFQSIFEDTKLFKLEQNYRSTQRIVKAANSLIRHNERQIPKEVFSKNEEGDKIIYIPTNSDRDEAVIVCRMIKHIMSGEHIKFSDFAVLYRTNAQNRIIEEQMRAVDIPYRIYGGLSFYQRKEIKDIIAYFRLVANPDDEEAFRRIVNYPARGIGNTTVSKVMDAAHQAGVSLWSVVCNPASFSLPVSNSTVNKLTDFKNLIQVFITRSTECDVAQLANEIIQQSGIQNEIFGDNSVEGLARQENVRELMNGIADFVDTRMEENRAEAISLSDYLQEVSLFTDLDSEGDDDTPRVTLMTIHSAKGLEFHTVFIVGMDEKIFPSPKSFNSLSEMEEERRLFYVAVTRAEKHCILTSAENRYMYGKKEYCAPSRFLRDIYPSLMEEKNIKEISLEQAKKQLRRSPLEKMWLEENKLKEKPVQTQAPRINGRVLKPVSSMTHVKPKTDPETIASVSEGCVIEHDRFGVGTVLRMEGTGENAKITVDFRNIGVKQLLVKFARFKIVK